MPIDRGTASKLILYAEKFREAREKSANEADTVMFLIRMFGEVLGYDSLAGEISKEVAIRDRYCDFCVKIEGEIEYLVEVKSAGQKNLKDKNIEQAENYASRAGINWVLLTNGCEWQMYHLVFAEQEGITHDLIFSVNLIENTEANLEKIWSMLRLLSKEAVLNDELDDFLSQKKALSPTSLIKGLISDPVLTTLRRELNRVSEIKLDVEDVFEAVKNILSRDALIEAGDLTYRKKRRRRRRSAKKDEAIATPANQDTGSVQNPATAPTPPQEPTAQTP